MSPDVETPYYCYGCGIRFTELYNVCPECGLTNCSERMSRQLYGEPTDEVYIPVEE